MVGHKRLATCVKTPGGSRTLFTSVKSYPNGNEELILCVVSSFCCTFRDQDEWERNISMMKVIRVVLGREIVFISLLTRLHYVTFIFFHRRWVGSPCFLPIVHPLKRDPSVFTYQWKHIENQEIFWWDEQELSIDYMGSLYRDYVFLGEYQRERVKKT